MVKIFKIDSLIKKERLEFKLTEYEIWAWYRAYLFRYSDIGCRQEKVIQPF